MLINEIHAVRHGVHSRNIHLPGCSEASGLQARLYVARQKSYDIKALIKAINRENLHEAVDFGAPVGKEVWQWPGNTCLTPATLFG